MPSLIQKFIKSHPVISMTASVVLFLGIQGAFSFCSTKKCPAFSDTAFDTWFPYQQTERVLFKNGSNTDTLAFWYKQRSEAYETGGFSTYGSRTCGTWAQYDGRFNSDITNIFSIHANYSENDQYYFLQLKGINVNITGMDVTQGIEFSNTEYSEIFFPSYVIGGRSFNNVQQITIDTTIVKAPPVSHFYLAANEGLIAYTEYPSGNVWVKQ